MRKHAWIAAAFFVCFAMLLLFAGCAAADAGVGQAADDATVIVARRQTQTDRTDAPLGDDKDKLPFFTADAKKTDKGSAAAESGITAKTTTGSADETTAITAAAAEAGSDPVAAADYVCNTNSKKFHLPGCGSVDTIKAANRTDYTGSRADLIAKGYVPCKRCKP